MASLVTRTDTANALSTGTYDVRRDEAIKGALLKLEQHIDLLLDSVSASHRSFTPEQLARALDDRELLTLELWARDEHEAIRKEVKRRRGEYEQFTRRFAAEPAEAAKPVEATES